MQEGVPTQQTSHLITWNVPETCAEQLIHCDFPSLLVCAKIKILPWGTHEADNETNMFPLTCTLEKYSISDIYNREGIVLGKRAK